MILFNIDPSNWTKFKDGTITVVANSSLLGASASVQGSASLNETSKYVKGNMPEMYSESSVYTVSLTQNVFPQKREGDTVVVDASFAFIDGSISVDAPIRLCTSWMNGDPMSGYDIIIPKYTTLMQLTDWQETHDTEPDTSTDSSAGGWMELWDDCSCNCDGCDSSNSSSGSNTSSGNGSNTKPSDSSKYVIDCSLYIYILNNAGVGMPTAAKYESFSDASVDPSAGVFSYVDGGWLWNPSDIFDVFKELIDLTGLTDPADASASLKCELTEDASLYVGPLKYPNGSMRGIVIAPSYPEGYVDEYEPLQVNVIQDKVSIYEKFGDWDADGNQSFILGRDACERCDGNLIPLYTKRDFDVRCSLQEEPMHMSIPDTDDSSCGCDTSTCHAHCWHDIDIETTSGTTANGSSA